MFTVSELETFSKWLEGLKDKKGAGVIASRIHRLSLGNKGNVEAVGEGVSELKVDFGPGYRVYFVERGGSLIILLCGGDKSSQGRDIVRAKAMAKELD